MTRKLLALALSLMLLAGAVPALATQPGETELLNPLGVYPTAKERKTLTILIEQNTLVEDYETNAFTKYIEELNNVDLEFEVLPAGEGLDKLAIMINSGQKLPDIVLIPLDTTTTYKYGANGAFIPLNELYDTQSYEFAAREKEYPALELKRYITNPDGNIYSIPRFDNGLHNEVMYKYWINTAWLEKVGQEMPATTDEFYTVLKAFKEGDPNGNGKADEFPLAGATGWSQDPTIFLMNAFIYDDSYNRFIVRDGKVDVAYAQEEWKQGLTYMHKLVAEDLLSPLSFTQDDAQLRAMVNNPDEAIVGAYAFSSITLLQLDATPYSGEYFGLEPLAGPGGVRHAAYVPSLPLNIWFISRDCELPELAFRVGDSMFNEYAALLARYGIEGTHWSRPEEGALSAYDGFPVTHSQDVNIWNQSQNAHWRNVNPVFAYDSPQGGVWDGNELSAGRRIGLIVPKYQDAKPQAGTFIPVLFYTEDEINQINEIEATLRSYVNECKTRFITGDMDIEKEWDAYLNELENIGLSHFLTIVQGAYDRMYK